MIIPHDSLGLDVAAALVVDDQRIASLLALRRDVVEDEFLLLSSRGALGIVGEQQLRHIMHERLVHLSEDAAVEVPDVTGVRAEIGRAGDRVSHDGNLLTDVA